VHITLEAGTVTGGPAARAGAAGVRLATHSAQLATHSAQLGALAESGR
jgi:hypothetical protein